MINESTEQAYLAMAKEKPSQSLVELHRAAKLCNNAMFDPVSLSLLINERSIQGNATDETILRFAETLKLVAPCVLHHREFEIPFNSKTNGCSRCFGTDATNSEKPHYVVYFKGDPDVLLPACSSYFSERQAQSSHLMPQQEETFRLCRTSSPRMQNAFLLSTQIHSHQRSWNERLDEVAEKVI